MRYAFCFTVVVLVGLLLAPGQAAAATIANPGFETGDFTGWDTPDTNTSLGLVSDPNAVHSGTYAAQFGALACCDVLSQTLATTRADYAISFYLQSDGGDAESGAGFDFLWNNVLIGSAPVGAFNYQQFTFNVANAGTTGILAFRGWNNAAFYHLDDVSIATVGPGPVPEPTTFALIGIGLSGVAILRRRYRR